MAVIVVLSVIGLARAQDSLIEINDGFAYKELEFAVAAPNEALGTMVNKSGKDYLSACFMMKLYNKTDQLLKATQFCIQDLSNGESKPFSLVTNTNPGTLKGYKIQFMNGKVRETR